LIYYKASEITSELLTYTAKEKKFKIWKGEILNNVKIKKKI